MRPSLKKSLLLAAVWACGPSPVRLAPVTVTGNLPIAADLVGAAFDYSSGTANGGTCTGEVIKFISGDGGSCADLAPQRGLIEIWICNGKSPVNAGPYPLGPGPLPTTNPSAVINFVRGAGQWSARDGGLSLGNSTESGLSGTFTASFDGGQYTAASTFTLPRCP